MVRELRSHMSCDMAKKKRETRVQSLAWEDSLEEGMATHSSILAWRIPMDREAWWATIHGVAKSLFIDAKIESRSVMSSSLQPHGL